MKTKSLVSLALASLMFVACSKKEDAVEVSKAPILLSSGLSVQTRAATALQSTQFENNATVGIFINENGGSTTTYTQPLAFSANGTGGLTIAPASQPFFPTSGNGVDIYGVYPAPILGTSVTATPAFTVSTDQSLDANYKASDLMTGTPASNPVARTTSSVPLTFYHRLAKLTVNLIAGAGQTDNSLLTNAVVKIKGTKIATTYVPKTGVVTAPTGAATDIVLKSAAVSALSGSAIIVPQTLAATTDFIEVTLANGGVFTYKIPTGGKTYAASTAYTFNVTVNLTGITVTTTIVDWTTGETIDTTVTQ